MHDVAVTRHNVVPWRRFFARNLDLAFAWLAFVLLMSAVNPAQFQNTSQLFLFMVAVILWVPIEVFCLSKFGTTPGKYILGLHLRRIDGQAIDVKAALDRSLSVWLKGLAIGAPLFNLFTYLTAYMDLDTKGRTEWDEELGYEVTYEPLERRMVATCMGAYFALYAVSFSVLILGQLI